jgi:hypothetical protein
MLRAIRGSLESWVALARPNFGCPTYYLILKKEHKVQKKKKNYAKSRLHCTFN